MKIATKSVAFELKESNDATGEFSGVASVYGNEDLGGDVVVRGAFTKTLKERGAEVPLLWQHDQKNPIGSGSLTDSASGLLIKGLLDLDIPEGRRAYSGLKKGYLKGLSIGYDVVKQKYEKGARHLTELKLWEVSTVTFPMNEDAEVTSVKAFDLGSFDVKAMGLPAATEQSVMALLTKSASLSARLNGAYAAVRAKYPLANAYPLSDEIYDDYLIVSSGCYDKPEYFSVLITAWSEDGVPTLGDAVEVERTYTPVTAADEAAEGETSASDGGDEISGTAASEAKAGRRVSTATATKLKAAHDYMRKAAAHVKDVLQSNKPTDSKHRTATPAAAATTAGAELASLLSDHLEQMRRMFGAQE